MKTVSSVDKTDMRRVTSACKFVTAAVVAGRRELRHCLTGEQLRYHDAADVPLRFFKINFPPFC